MHQRRHVRIRGGPCRGAVGCAVLAAGWLMACGQAAAQTQVPPELLAPTLDTGSDNLPTFRRERPRATGAPTRFDPLPPPPTYGTPPASGAGQSGYDSVSPPPEPVLPYPDTPPDTVPASRRGAPPVVVPPADDFVTPERRVGRPRRGDTEDPYDPLGIRVGTFIVKPAIELKGGYDTNPAREPSARGGKVVVIAPELKLQSNWSRHELRADLRGSYTTYPGFRFVPSLDQPNADTKVNGRIDVTRQTRIDLEGRFTLRTENPTSPDLPAGVAELPIVTSRGVTAGLAHRFNRLELGASVSIDRNEYGKSKLTDGSVFDNGGRNYRQEGVKLRGGYELSPGINPFVEVGLDRRKHDAAIDVFGFRRDSTGRQISVGSTFKLTGKLTGSAAVGYAVRRYEDPALAELAGLIADASLVWTATPLSTLTLTARSINDESTLAGVSGVLRRDLGLQIDHAFRRWLIGTVKFSYGRDQYVGSPRVDDRYGISGLLTYKLSREVWLKGEVRREWQTSNVGSDYTANIFLFGVRLQR